MEQITPEIKAKIFALYWGQSVIWMSDREPRHKHHVCGKTMKSTALEHMRLGLKPISSITDEDAVECLSLMVMKGYKFKTLMEYSDHNKYSNEQKVNYFNRNIPYYMDSLRLVDHLRLKGYALPAFGYSVDQLVEAGIFKLKEVDND